MNLDNNTLIVLAGMACFALLVFWWNSRQGQTRRSHAPAPQPTRPAPRPQPYGEALQYMTTVAESDRLAQEKYRLIEATLVDGLTDPATKVATEELIERAKTKAAATAPSA